MPPSTERAQGLPKRTKHPRNPSSTVSIGTACAQQHLRPILGYLDMPTLGQPEAFLQAKDEFFDAQGGIGNEGSRKFVQQWLQRYAAFVGQESRVKAAA